MSLLDLKWCSDCVAMSTRPRLNFSEEGLCSACQWSQAKKRVDWGSREKELMELLDQHRSSGKFDVLVPVSGGKDGSYVAYQLKHKYGMNPLCVTVNPHLPLEIGIKNLRNFAESGFDLVTCSPRYDAMRLLNTIGLEKKGFPYYGWLIAIHTAVLRLAENFGIDLIFYGEDGEVEYGGDASSANIAVYGPEYMEKIYLEGGYDLVMREAKLSEADRFWFSFPKIARDGSLKVTHWSYFEAWDSYRNYLVAKEHCGLEEGLVSGDGTFTNFAQNDQALYALHAFLMFLKYGFGRANQDACIEIRRGAMSRQQALELVRLYDGLFPIQNLDVYCDYYQLSPEQFRKILCKWTNSDLFDWPDVGWEPIRKFEIS